MKKKVFLVFISIILFLTGCSNDSYLNELDVKADEILDKEVEANELDIDVIDEVAEDTKNIYLDLSEQDIQEAIKEGEKGLRNILEYLPQNYGLKYISGEDRLIDRVEIMTPYSSIATISALKSSKYQEISKDDIDGLLKDYEYTMLFSVGMYGTSIDFPKFVHIILKQDDKVIQPMEIHGIDNLAEISSNWPDFPEYEAIFNPVFSTKEIDFNINAELIIIFANEIEIKYEVDFSKYK
ncbi:hypothetical protein AAK964_12310 [Tissierella praeacuta]|uniref:hypothetical protein n=1 Tax=Tissierella praeacuta TaxID=43131 RepID=UPI00351730E7